VITIQIKIRIKTELFIDRKATLYVGETRIRVKANKGDQGVGIRVNFGETHTQYLDLKGGGMKDQVATFLAMRLTGM